MHMHSTKVDGVFLLTCQMSFMPGSIHTAFLRARREGVRRVLEEE